MPTHGGGNDPDDHYQPWLRNQPPGPGSGSVNRPQPLPTTQATPAPVDMIAPVPARPVLGMSADELLARPIALPDQDLPPSPGLAVRIGKVADAVGIWTGERLERADIAGRIARLQPGEQADKVARTSAAAVRTAARVTAKRAELVAAVALPRLRLMADRARTGIAAGAGTASRILSDGGRRLASSLSELPAATRSALAARGPAPVTSQLDRLVAEEAMAQSSGQASEQSLPLFSQSGTEPPASAQAAHAAAPATEPAASGDPGPSAGQSTDTGSAAAPAPIAATGRSSGAGGVGGRGIGGDGSGGGQQPGNSPSNSGWLRHPASWVAGGVAMVLSGFVAGMMWDGGSNRAVTERIVHDYILNNPEIIPQAMERLQAERVAAAIDGQRRAIEMPFSGAWAGAADGDVTLTVFTDYACTYCRASVADIDRLLREDRRLKVVFRELPILSQDSEIAARFALSAARSGR